MLARDAFELFAEDVEDEDVPLTLDAEEWWAIRNRLVRANELEKENNELREKLVARRKSSSA